MGKASDEHEYSNKLSLEYYSYLNLCHCPIKNIFGYSLVEFWTNKYIQICVLKFLEIQIYLNICSEPYFNICLSFFNKKKSIFRYNLCIKNMQSTI